MSNIYWLNKDSRTFLSRGYLPEGMSAEQRIRQIAEAAQEILQEEGFADKFESYMHKGWFSLASPIWSNFGAGRGLSISCNGSYIPDTIKGILKKNTEAGMMSKNGAGTSGYFGDVRCRGSAISTGGKTSGAVHFMELFNATTNIINQSGVRRGQFAAYLPIDHGDILEFLQIRSEGHPIQHMSIGVTITDAWMKSMIGGDKQKQSIWRKVIQKRCETGFPYIFWTDTVNNNKPQVYKDLELMIWASNLCTEIALPAGTSKKILDKIYSFVCDLSSMNLIHWEDWKDTDAIQVLFRFLDAVMSDYISKTDGEEEMKHANDFAKDHRAIGLGVLGWHSYLQSKMIPFESLEAKLLNVEIFKKIDEETLKASKYMAERYGEPELLKGYGLRNTTRIAIAPTTSSSQILGQPSPGIEPLNGNYFVKDLDKGKFTYKNPYLTTVLDQHEKNDKATWDSILVKGGSVQHLDFLSDLEKDVFKTFGEISQKEIIIQAAARQKYIDQAQSINLMIHPKTSLKDINSLMISAWEMGVKTLYYQRSTNPAQELGRNILSCVSCEA